MWLGHWWPLILIFWGAIKLYERMAAKPLWRSGRRSDHRRRSFSRAGTLSLLGIVVAVDYGRKISPVTFVSGETVLTSTWRSRPNPFPRMRALRYATAAATLACVLRTTRRFEFRQKKRQGLERERRPAKLPSTLASKSCRMATATKSILLVWAPAIRGSAWTLTWRSEEGLVDDPEREGRNHRRDMAKPVSVTNGVGDIEIRDTAGDVSIDTRKSDIKVSDTKGTSRFPATAGI